MRIKIDKVKVITFIVTIALCCVIDDKNTDKNVDVSSLINEKPVDSTTYKAEIELERKTIQDLTEQITDQIGKESIQHSTEEKIPIPDDWIVLKEVDMEAFQNVMKAEEYIALMEYMDVLTGKASFEWTTDFDATKKTYVTIEEFCHQLNREMYEVDDLWLDSLAVCDLTQDGGYELILLLKNVGNEYLILHKEGADFYGVNMVYRGFEAVQTNGVYIGSSGAAYSDYLQLVFENKTFSEKLLGHTDYDFKKNIPLLYIGEETVDENTFFAWTDSIMTGDVQFYKPKVYTKGQKDLP